jgi:NH3-dependent NAD+ synthetase
MSQILMTQVSPTVLEADAAEVYVAMSGGVDSSMAAVLLKKKVSALSARLISRVIKSEASS